MSMKFVQRHNIKWCSRPRKNVHSAVYQSVPTIRVRKVKKCTSHLSEQIIQREQKFLSKLECPEYTDVFRSSKTEKKTRMNKCLIFDMIFCSLPNFFVDKKWTFQKLENDERNSQKRSPVFLMIRILRFDGEKYTEILCESGVLNKKNLSIISAGFVLYFNDQASFRKLTYLTSNWSRKCSSLQTLEWNYIPGIYKKTFVHLLKHWSNQFDEVTSDNLVLWQKSTVANLIIIIKKSFYNSYGNW